jgi:hypothetical protein
MDTEPALVGRHRLLLASIHPVHVEKVDAVRHSSSFDRFSIVKNLDR